MQKTFEYHTINKISEGTYQIVESGFVCSYLLIGSEKALLIDTGNGSGNIRKVVESITDKPIEVFITHRHADHISGAGWFEQVYLHKADLSKYMHLKAVTLPQYLLPE